MKIVGCMQNLKAVDPVLGPPRSKNRSKIESIFLSQENLIRRTACLGIFPGWCLSWGLPVAMSTFRGSYNAQPSKGSQRSPTKSPPRGRKPVQKIMPGAKRCQSKDPPHTPPQPRTHPQPTHPLIHPPARQPTHAPMPWYAHPPISTWHWCAHPPIHISGPNCDMALVCPPTHFDMALVCPPTHSQFGSEL